MTSSVPLIDRLTFVIVTLAALCLPAPVYAQGKPGAIVQTAEVRAELIAHAPEGADPGKPVWVGLQLAHQSGWHTYWKNPGDSGLASTLNWTLPAGVMAGEINWPVPHKINIGTLTNYGYEGTVLLPVPLTITPEFKPPLLGNELEIKLKASWLVCRQECIPQDGEFAIKLPVRGSTALHSAEFLAADALYPRELVDTQNANPSSTARVQDQRLLLEVHGLPDTLRNKPLVWFPETPAVLHNAVQPAKSDAPLSQQTWSQTWDGNVWRANLPLSPERSQSPELMHFVLVPETGKLAGQAWLIKAQVQGKWPATNSPAEVSPALAAALKANAQAVQAPAAGASASLLITLLGAMLGGLILNLMPCVFPVLAIKVVGFTQHADDRRAHRASGWAYTGGVLLSFLALGGLMLALRAAGEQLGWGFQLQSPAVVAGLAALFTLIGLNLAGMFELGQFLPSRLTSMQAQHPTANAFLSGVLAVAVASPCTAPFMGASLGVAVSLPATQALLVFAAIGLGMALPYLLASLVPAVARALPRPGAWMDTLRKFLAFPMLATVVWLVWVLGQQSGLDGAAILLTLLLELGFLAWALGLTGLARLCLAPVAAVVLVWTLWSWGPVMTQQVTANTPTSPSATSWDTWSPDKVETLTAAGRTVFVDFTAAWCVTCQYNKKTTLADPEVLSEVSARQVALLRADWTRRDPMITQALAALGRSGVPVYVLYRPGRPPLVLSEVLTVSEVLAALAQ
ncbi:MAG: hypothetical protein RLZZ591_2322 [Pseudomonadota bacterium]